jgi:hypothetical protein
VGKKNAAVEEKDLERWRLVERFQRELAAVREVRGGSEGTWSDPRRQLQLEEYLGLFLFGLFNPVVKSLRGLSAASGLKRVQEEVCGRAVSLGSFSEAQAVVEPALLEAVFARLVAQTPPAARGDLRPAVVIDSTVWPVLPRMSWAFWRRQHGLGNAVRLHVEFDLEKGSVRRATLTRAKTCERAQWRRWAQPGTCYIGDRYYGYDYALLGELQARQVDFVVRLRADTQWVEETQVELSAADRAAAVVGAWVVRLGKAGEGPRVRVVQVLGEEESIVLATTLPADSAPPELLAALYRHRWQVELFFRWLKCILGCRAWLAESPRGVALQCYLALIAAQLLLLYTGRRPNKRQMETIQFYLMGWCSVEELVARATAARAKKN